MNYRKILLAFFLMMASALSLASQSTDLQYPPISSGGHDFNHAPIGQSFVALASSVKGGLFIADQDSFTAWLLQTYPSLPPYPYAIASSLTIKVDLIEGEGVGGNILDSQVVVLNKPFMGFVDVDYAAAGVMLVPGNQYTLLLTDVSGQYYPSGVTGWVVPAVSDFSTNASLPPGAYPDGLPILQGNLILNDAGIGDNSFEVLDVGNTTPQLALSGTLPDGITGEAYTASLSASGGVPPYSWSATGLPAGLIIDDMGNVSGIPSEEGTFSVAVTVIDSVNNLVTENYSLVISPLSCTIPNGAKSSKGKGSVTDVGDGFIMVRNKHIDYTSCTTIEYGGNAVSPAVGDRVEWQGYVEANGNIMAQILTFN